jgi:hypothetical protein
MATQSSLPTKDGKVVLTYIPNEVADKSDARKSAVSVNISAIPAELDRILASHCTQPEQAGMTGVALAAHNPVLVKLNPELFSQFQNTTAKEWADKVFSGSISYNDATKTMTQLAGFLTIFNSSYQKDLKTDWNYYAHSGVLTTEANVRPIIENPEQYVGDFEKFEIIDKTGNVLCLDDLKPFGINLGVGGDTNKGDQRIAGFTCATPPPPPPSGSCVGALCNPQPCPPGKVVNINGECVTSKSSDPKGYVFPTDKPTAVNDGGTDKAPVVPTATPTATPSPSPSSTPVKQPDAPTPTEAPTTCPIPPGMTSC